MYVRTYCVQLSSSDIPVGVSVFQDVVSVQVGGTSESSTQLEETPVVIVFTVQKVCMATTFTMHVHCSMAPMYAYDVYLYIGCF